MARTNPLGVRVRPEIKEALEKAATDDDRSVSSIVERILQEWLTGRGYLSKPATTAAPKSRKKPESGGE